MKFNWLGICHFFTQTLSLNFKVLFFFTSKIDIPYPARFWTAGCAMQSGQRGLNSFRWPGQRRDTGTARILIWTLFWQSCLHYDEENKLTHVRCPYRSLYGYQGCRSGSGQIHLFISGSIKTRAADPDPI